MPAPDSAGSGLAATYETETHSPANRITHVLVCDEVDSRFEFISRIVIDCGKQPLQTSAYVTLDRLPWPCLAIALVAVEDCPAFNSAALNMVRALVRRGLVVICYSNQPQKWPLGKRCSVSLAGALTLLDSAGADFAGELKQTVAQVLGQESTRRAKEVRIKYEMRKLGLIGESSLMRSIFWWVQRVSTLSDLPALIIGETGTGKELLVNAIHRLDRKRSKQPLIALNCGAITAGVAESELFGHRRGAFTGAERDRPGLIRAANGGILFLDEIGDLDAGLQSKLLRVLQENRVLSLGEDREVPVDVRVIAATNRNLGEMVEKGTFRADLFHRLNILSVHIAPLRQRRVDIKPLVQHFIEKHHALMRVKTPSFNPEFVEALAQLELPGNVREVENLVRLALVNKTTDGPLGLSDLPPEILAKLAGSKAGPASPDQTNQDNGPNHPTEPILSADLDSYLYELLNRNEGNLTRTLEHCERVLISTALQVSHGNQSQVARRLGITPRSVYNKLQKYHLRRH